MQLSLEDSKAIRGYKSRPQIVRILTEKWFVNNMYCPACGNFSVRKCKDNTPLVDFWCENCNQLFQLKSKGTPLGNKIVDAGNHENRIPYLKLYDNWNMVHGYFGPPEGWIPELKKQDPDYIVTSHTYSRIKEFAIVKQDTLYIKGADDTYHKLEKYGFFNIFQKSESIIDTDSLAQP